MATITSTKSGQASSKPLTILVIGGSGMIGSRITVGAAFAMAMLDELETPRHLKSQMTIAAN
jgi:hypothetical protein